MLSTTQIVALAFALVAPAVALNSTTPIPTSTIDMANRPLGTAIGGALDILATETPSHTLFEARQAGMQSVTINLVNSMNTPVSVSYVSNVATAGQAQISLVNNPQPGVIQPAATTQVIMPQGWAGRGIVGIDGDDVQGTKWEASLTSDGGFQPFIDVSYVDGYSVPMTCSCGGTAVAGCNLDLFAIGTPCPSLGPGPVCYNPQQNVPDGPAQAFFAPCLGAAYTFPNDNLATSGCGMTSEFDCCVGSACPATARQLYSRSIADSPNRVPAGRSRGE